MLSRALSSLPYDGEPTHATPRYGLRATCSYFVKLYEHVAGTIALEGCEHYIKQSYRNRCRILGPNGVQSLTIPVELPAGTKTPIREVRISDHGEWRHLHAQALRTAYGASPVL